MRKNLLTATFHFFCTISFILLLTFPACQNNQKNADARPNIVLLLADDLGHHERGVVQDYKSIEKFSWDGTQFVRKEK